MRFKVIPEDFVVEEWLRLPPASAGTFAIYRVHKRGVPTLNVQAQMARMIKVPRSRVVFPALKDKEAVATQHAAVRGSGPARLTGEGFEAERIGYLQRPLAPADIVANRFTLVLRDLTAEEERAIPPRLAQINAFGLPNYFDDQRFGSFSSRQEPLGKRILQRDVEGALRAYLTQPCAGDPAPVRRFKAMARTRWGDWASLFELAPRPSNFRSVLTYLRDHPMEYRRALNLITPRLLGLYLAAYQSWLWNRIAARWLEALLGEMPESVEIAGERFPVFCELPADFDRDAVLPLPSHQAVYRDPVLAVIVGDVLAQERLSLGDLKARVLKKAYLPRGNRPLLLFPRETTLSTPAHDERFPGRRKVVLSFALPRGGYATLVLKALASAPHGAAGM